MNRLASSLPATSVPSIHPQPCAIRVANGIDNCVGYTAIRYKKGFMRSIAADRRMINWIENELMNFRLVLPPIGECPVTAFELIRMGSTVCGSCDYVFPLFHVQSACVGGLPTASTAMPARVTSSILRNTAWLT